MFRVFRGTVLTSLLVLVACGSESDESSTEQVSAGAGGASTMEPEGAGGAANDTVVEEPTPDPPPGELVWKTTTPQELTTDGTTLYWADAAGFLSSMLIAGGDRVPLAKIEGQATHITPTPSGLFYSQETTLYFLNAAGDPEVFASSVTDFTVAEGFAYYGSGAALLRKPLTGGDSEELSAAANLSLALAVQGDAVFYHSNDELFRLTIGGSTDSVLSLGQPIHEIVTDADWLYLRVGTAQKDALSRVRHDGSDYEELLTGGGELPANLHNIEVSGGYLYALGKGVLGCAPSWLGRVELASGTSETLLDNFDCATDYTVQGAFVYYANAQLKQIKTTGIYRLGL